MSTTHHTWFGKLFEAIGDIFKNALEKAWENLPAEVQSAMKDGSGILALINDNGTLDVTALLALIKEGFPNLDDATLLTGLTAVAKALNIPVTGTSLTGTIAAIQAYIVKLEGTFWAGISSLAAKTLAAILAPDGTAWDTFETLMSYVYQTYIKKS